MFAIPSVQIIIWDPGFPAYANPKAATNPGPRAVLPAHFKKSNPCNN